MARAKAVRHSFTLVPVALAKVERKSINFPNQKYIGITDNLEEQLTTHNSGGSIYTKPYKPWIVIAYFAFQEEKTTQELEKYLKTGAGRAFAKKHFW
jgi:putative endonuclease